MLYLEINVDILFLINFIMDLIILKILKKILKQKCTWVRLMCASGVGALFTCIIAIFYSIPNFIKFILMYIIVSMIMVMIAFSYKDLINIMKGVFLLFAVTYFLGGILNSLYYYTNLGFYFNELIHARLYSNRSIKYFVTAGIVSYIIVKVYLYFFINIRSNQKSIYQTELIYNGKQLSLKGFLDTGNSLREPLSNKPVIIGEYDVMKEIFPDDLNEFLVTYYKEKDSYINLKDELAIKIRFIPFHSIGKANGNLIGIQFDEVNIIEEENTVLNEKVIVAIFLGKLTAKDNYQLILHKELL